MRSSSQNLTRPHVLTPARTQNRSRTPTLLYASSVASALTLTPTSRFMGGGAARAAPPKVHEVAFPVSLEDLYKGATKRLKITRRVEDAASPGQLKTESVRPLAQLQVQVRHLHFLTLMLPQHGIKAAWATWNRQTTH